MFTTDDAWQSNFGGGLTDAWYAIYQENALNSNDVSPLGAARLYPNPAREQLWVELPEGLHAAQYSVYDMMGKAVMQGNFAERRNTLATGALPPGMYLLEYRAGHERGVGKFIRE